VDSYPEIYAQRNAEDGGFLLSGLARRGGSRFLLFIYCIGAIYSLGVEDKTESKINIKRHSSCDPEAADAGMRPQLQYS
jgi:hypothetical protein